MDEFEKHDQGIILAHVPCEVSKKVACIVMTFWGPEDKRLFLLPRYFFNPNYLHEMRVQGRLSKNKERNGSWCPSPGNVISFYMVGRHITDYTREPKNARCGPKLISCGGIHGPIQFELLCVISDDTPERRIRFQWFNEFLQVPQGVLHAYMPYVPYCCLVSVYLDISNFNDNQPINANAPTFRVEFNRIINVAPYSSDEFPDDYGSPIKWLHEQAFAHWHHEKFPAVHPYMPKKMYPQTDGDWDLNTYDYAIKCIVIDEKEAYCCGRPYARCFFGFPAVAGDFHFVPGRILYCYMYYSLYNHCYVINRYHPCHNTCDNFWKWYKSVGLNCENPMKTRMKNGYRQFLAWVKLNTFGHFYCSYGIPYITDPKNIMHGRFPLGKEQERQHEPGVGIRCWLRYNSGEETFRWTIDELFEANDSQVLHEEFSSCGFLLNKRGSVYCPHVCNFPLQISENVKRIGYICKDNTMRKVSANPEVGDWFLFRAKFDPITERYMIFQIDGVDKEKKLPCVLLPGEKDTYAFRIPLRENFYHSNNLLVSFENEKAGLVEDVEQKVTAFVVAWAQTHKANKAIPKAIPIWCRENPDSAKRKTPLCVLGIMKNPATDMPAIQQEDRGEEEEYGKVY